MSSLITDARDQLAQALENTGVRVYAVAPKVPIAPCLAVTAGQPWMIPERLGGPLQVRVRWTVLAVVRDDAEHVTNLEQLIEDVLESLPDGVTVDQVGPPQSLAIGAQGSVMAAEIALNAHVSD